MFIAMTREQPLEVQEIRECATEYTYATAGIDITKVMAVVHHPPETTIGSRIDLLFKVQGTNGNVCLTVLA